MTLTWVSDYEQQQVFVRDIRQRIELLNDRVVPTTVHNVGTPTPAELQAGWAERKGYDMNIPVFARTQWYDPLSETIEQEYRKIQDLTGPARSSDTLYGMTPRIPDSVPVPTCLGMQYIDDTAAAGPFLFPDIPQTHKDLLCFVMLRDVTAATSALMGIRPNASAVGQYGQSYITGNNAFIAGYGAELASQTSWLVTMPANTSERIQYATFLFRIFKYTTADNAKKMWLYGTTFFANPPAAANKVNYQMHGVWNNAAPITSLSIISNGGQNFQAGSKAVLWAL